MIVSKSGAKLFCFSFEGRAFNILDDYIYKCAVLAITMHAKIVVGTNFHHLVKEESIKSNNIVRDTKYLRATIICGYKF